MNRIVLLGDSITAGMTNGYPSPIFSHKLASFLPEVEFINRGVPGDITRLAKLRLQADVLEVDPDLVVVFFGTNDVADPQTDLEDYRSNLEEICRTVGLEKCLLITPGLVGPSQEASRPTPKMAAFAKATLELGQDLDIPTLNWQAIMEKHIPASLLQADEIHYNERAYDLLVANLVPLLKIKLAQVKPKIIH